MSNLIPHFYFLIEFAGNIRRHYLHSESANIFFVVDNDSPEIPAHKFMLAAGSHVFEKMFYGPLRERATVILNPDASEDGFKEFLKVFYCSCVNIQVDHIDELLYLTLKYNINNVFKKSMSCIVKTMNNENVCKRLDAGILYLELHPELIKACETQVMLNTARILEWLERDALNLYYNRVFNGFFTKSSYPAKNLVLCIDNLQFQKDPNHC